MNAVVQLQPQGALAQQSAGGRMAVADIIQHVAVVQEVMRAVMKPEVHYGKIPGTDKPTLYKAGAEVLCMVFRVADTYEVTDLSTADSVRYRVNCIGTHQVTGVVLGSGLGEASSGEEKYKWRKAVNPQEWEETPANMRRKKHSRGKGGTFYVQEQIRTEPADLANTILKMANKRAKMAMVLNVTAASDCFAQDLEDMDDALRDHLSRHENDAPAAQEQQQGTLPEFTQEHLDQRKDKIAEFYAKGKTADDIVAFYSLKSHLPELMKKAIRELAPKANAAPAVTAQQLDERMRAAKNEDALNEAASLMSAITDEAQRKELDATYEFCLAGIRG